MGNEVQAAEQSKPPGTAIAKFPTGAELQAMVFSFIDQSDEAGKIAVFNATQSQDSKAKELIGLPLPVENFVIHPVEFVARETGEIKPGLRTVLIMENGERVSCCSDGVVNGLRNLVRQIGAPPWRPACLLLIKEENTSFGNRTYILERVASNGQVDRNKPG